MVKKDSGKTQKVVFDIENFQNLLNSINKKGYKTFGPVQKDNAVSYDEISSINEMPIGRIDTQNAGTYRLLKSKHNSMFEYVVGFDSWKKILRPPIEKIYDIHRHGQDFEIKNQKPNPGKRAFIGIRSCELHAIDILDKALIGSLYPDTAYIEYRKNLFIVAVNCIRPGGTCFCASMKSGPKAISGFDLALTEVFGKDVHYFIVDIGSNAGARIIEEVPHRQAKDTEIQSADKIMQSAEKSMGRQLDTKGIRELLQDNYDHPHWEDVARRCLTCGNCTMVCPTCFCSTIEDVTDLSGQNAERWRKTDVCFSLDFSYIYGGSVRSSPKSRYRQWMTHKLSTWIDQFGTSGCVGCGRCITWCPVGIDITEEAKAIRK
ncbi:MAG: sulfite reductase subunit A [candidate division Zixibacteria bacterium]|nr:sulfite reductase subunit A [candidate division Zixibacteria bacterium]